MTFKSLRRAMLKLQTCIRGARLITFDVTGTLLNFSRNPVLLYMEEAEKRGFKTDLKLLSNNFKQSWIEQNERFPCFGARHQMHWTEWWTKLVNKTFEGTELDEISLLCIAEALIEKFKSPLCWNLENGSVELLDFLRDKKKAIGVITNFDPRIYTILDNLSMLSRFDFVINSYDVKFCKPERQIFDLALLKCSGLKPWEAVHIGDSFHFDYKPPKLAGWEAILVNQDDSMKNIPRFNSIQNLKLFIEECFK
ncbi:rhythmically expressed gene 2 protein-like isoform X2 [Artemia franciscana]|uniref:Haloacid dehalogenase-like hydrolase domain-containing protein 3 n=1 Tax=Artemia franciscana TaxID=6661 RepID=A0AA88ID88_ARTSF|nr:hypothetical protein QYM36_007832 [Artemia franciscana]